MSTLAEARVKALELEAVMLALPDREERGKAAVRMADWAAKWARAAGMESQWYAEIVAGGGGADVQDWYQAKADALYTAANELLDQPLE